jgi:hypothetical protein
MGARKKFCGYLRAALSITRPKGDIRSSQGVTRNAISEASPEAAISSALPVFTSGMSWPWTSKQAKTNRGRTKSRLEGRSALVELGVMVITRLVLWIVGRWLELVKWSDALDFSNGRLEKWRRSEHRS